MTQHAALLLSGLCLLLCLTCFYVVVAHHYRRGDKALAVLLVVFAPLGCLFAYVFGWLDWRERRIRAVKVVWTVSIVALGHLLPATLADR